ncbi:MAG: EthD family reductase [Rudaea sp.]
MIKVSVMYPAGAGHTFNMDYYLKEHGQLLKDRLGSALKRIAVDSGVAGGAPNSPPTYIAMGHLYFDSVDAFQTSFGPHADEILGDLPNFTNTQPTIQISDVKL